MPEKEQFLFVSYARDDYERVSPIIEAVQRSLEFRALPLKLWIDVSNLSPGEQWDIAITKALESSVGFLFFLSPRSVRSDWIRRELQAAAAAADRLIIPILLHRADAFRDEIPQVLSTRQWLDLSGRPSADRIAEAAEQIADVTEMYLRRPLPRQPISSAEVSEVAAEIANETRSAGEAEPTNDRPNSVFVVHGHDRTLLAEVESYLTSVGVTPIVLSRVSEAEQSLFQRFLQVSKQAKFAIVLLTADDIGASRRQYEADGVADRALQFRARQNVILEMGFFYGKLGWENVFVVHREPDRVFPNFERPSDLEGIVFQSTTTESWRTNLSQKLRDAKFLLESA